MDPRSMMDTLERVLDRSKIAVLATVESDGKPHMRWMTPGLVRGRDRCLYAVTSGRHRREYETGENAAVEWMIQSRSLDEILTVTGLMRVIDNPSVKAEVLEAIGRHLASFWKQNPDEADMVVLETVIDEIRYTRPATGERKAIRMEAVNG